MKWTLKFLASLVLVFGLACVLFYLEALFLLGMFLHIASMRLSVIPIVLIFVIMWKLPRWMKL